MDFPEHLRNIRKSNSKTQKQVATAIGVTERNYQRYELGDQKPAFDVLIALADCFNVSLDYLVGRSDNPNIDKSNEGVGTMELYRWFLALPEQKQAHVRRAITLRAEQTGKIDALVELLDTNIASVYIWSESECLHLVSGFDEKLSEILKLLDLEADDFFA